MRANVYILSCQNEACILRAQHGDMICLTRCLTVDLLPPMWVRAERCINKKYSAWMFLCSPTVTSSLDTYLIVYVWNGTIKYDLWSEEEEEGYGCRGGRWRRGSVLQLKHDAHGCESVMLTLKPFLVTQMFGFHKPKMYRSLDGCCICRAKSSSSRFTDSKRYEKEFRSCFG